MEDFRRFIIGTAETMQFLGVILGTLGAGLVGKLYGRLIALGAGSQNAGGYEFVGFLVGAAIGFVIAATAAAIFLLLSETAANTRQVAVLMERNSGLARMSPSDGPHRQNIAPSRLAAEHPQATSKPLTGSMRYTEPVAQSTAFPDLDEVHGIITKAEEAGFTVDTTKDKITLKRNDAESYCYDIHGLSVYPGTP